MLRLAWVLACWVALLGCSSEQDFALKNGVWHYLDSPIADSDSATFKVLDAHYAKDRARVYHADTQRKGQEYFLIRHVRVHTITGADPPSFRILRDGYARDERNVYHEGYRFAVEDVASFTVLDDGFARDSLRGYYLRAVVEGSHGASFEALGNDYARDRQRAYYCLPEPDAGKDGRPRARALVLAGVAPADLAVLGANYAKSSVRVFHRGLPVVGAHAPSFTLLDPAEDDADAQDHGARYQRGKRAAAPKAQAAASVPAR